MTSVNSGSLSPPQSIGQVSAFYLCRDHLLNQQYPFYLPQISCASCDTCPLAFFKRLMCRLQPPGFNTAGRKSHLDGLFHYRKAELGKGKEAWAEQAGVEWDGVDWLVINNSLLKVSEHTQEKIPPDECL